MGGYNGGGFSQPNDEGPIFGHVGGDLGSRGDYATWDWKRIEAAITGMAAGDFNDPVNIHTAKAAADPDSLANAAEIFHVVWRVLVNIAQSLTDQTAALAGSDGPWKGEAAKAFTDMMDTFSKQVAATADVLSGGSLGTHAVFQQLENNSVTLRTAQAKIREIDEWYATQASDDGVTPVDGLIPISSRPQLVSWMNDDMRAVLVSLAATYQVTVDAIRAPVPITPPAPKAPPKDDTGKNGPTQNDAGNGGGAGGGTGGGTGGKGGGNRFNSSLTPPPTTTKTPKPFPGNLGLGGPNGKGNGSKGGTGKVPPPITIPYPRGTGLGGPHGNLGSGGLNHAHYPGGTGLGLGGLFRPPAYRSNSDPLGLGNGLGGARRYTGQAEPETTGPRAPTGSGLTEEVTPPRTTTLTSSGPGAAEGGGGAGMPMMPGMGGGAGQQNTRERSDASGLLDSDGRPWTGEPEGEDEVGSQLGATAGGAVLDLPDEEEALVEGLLLAEALAVATAGGSTTAPPGRGTGPSTAERSGGAAANGSAGAGDVDGGTWNETWTGEFDESEDPGAPTGLAGFDSILTAPSSAPPTAPAPAAAHPAAPPVTTPGAAPELTLGSDGLPVPAAPAVLPVPTGGEDPGSSADWDVAGAAFVPLLWSVPAGNEPETVLAGRTREAAATWTGEGEPETGESLASDPLPATWQPSPVPATAPAASLLNVKPRSCGGGSSAEEQDGEDAEEPEESRDQQHGEEETPEPGIAELLVQERNTWGSAAPEGFDALG